MLDPDRGARCPTAWRKHMSNEESVRTIFIIRHGEKPEQKDGYGVDDECNLKKTSLLPRGWQRAGALVRLFAPLGDPRPGLTTPKQLIAPDYGKPADNLEH